MAEAEAPALPADILADIRTLATEGFNFWKENSTEAQRAVGMEELRKWSEDQTFIAQEMESIQADFDAQSPVDGRVDEAKYIAWIKAMQAKSSARGNFEDSREEPMKRTYAILNRLTAGSDGVSMDDFNSVMGPWMAIFGELKAAAGM